MWSRFRIQGQILVRPNQNQIQWVPLRWSSVIWSFRVHGQFLPGPERNGISYNKISRIYGLDPGYMVNFRGHWGRFTRLWRLLGHFPELSRTLGPYGPRDGCPDVTCIITAIQDVSISPAEYFAQSLWEMIVSGGKSEGDVSISRAEYCGACEWKVRATWFLAQSSLLYSRRVGFSDIHHVWESYSRALKQGPLLTRRGRG